MLFVLEHGKLDLERRVFWGPGGETRLSTIESRLLSHLSAHPGRTFSREELQVEVWGYRSGIPSRTVFTTVGRIRQKIEADPSKPRTLVSTDGGYCFVAPEKHAADSTLPHPATPFVGRTRELSQLLALLRKGARLVSLLGPGGIGKTRVAIECARQFGPELSGGAAFIALESVEHATALVRALIEVLALRPLSPREEPVAGLVDRLRDREQLLLCDNVEQIEGAAALFAALIAGCPALRILATSRVRLSLQAEAAVSLAPMPDPSSGADLERTDAGLLVLDRAQRARPGWEPSATERDALAELCALSDGSPLAIELATAWLRLLEPREVVRELKAGVDLLRTNNPDVPARHTSIRAMLASSFRLLALESERALGALATTRAPFSRETALAVAKADLRELGQLVDASMIRRVEGGRFAFHPAVRDEALARLTVEQRAEFEQAHAACFLDRLTKSYFEGEDAPERAWLERVEPDHLDTLAAFEASVRRHDLARVGDAAEPLYRYLDGKNRFAELASCWAMAKRELRALEPSPARDRALGRLLALEQGAGWLHDDGADFLAMLEPLGGADLVVGLIGASIRAQIAGQFPVGLAHGQRALELGAATNRSWLIGFALSVAASSAARVGQLDLAAGMLEQAVSMSARRGGRSVCRPLVHLGEVRSMMGQTEAAIQVLTRALAACRDADDRAFALLALSLLADARAASGEDPTALMIEAIEEGCAHHIPPFWWAGALLGLCERRANAAASAGPALTALSALCRGNLLPPPVMARAARASACAREALGPAVAAGLEHAAAGLELEVAALGLIAE